MSDAIVCREQLMITVWLDWINQESSRWLTDRHRIAVAVVIIVDVDGWKRGFGKINFVHNNKRTESHHHHQKQIKTMTIHRFCLKTRGNRWCWCSWSPSLKLIARSKNRRETFTYYDVVMNDEWIIRFGVENDDRGAPRHHWRRRRRWLFLDSGWGGGERMMCVTSVMTCKVWETARQNVQYLVRWHLHEWQRPEEKTATSVAEEIRKQAANCSQGDQF